DFVSTPILTLILCCFMVHLQSSSSSSSRFQDNVPSDVYDCAINPSFILRLP
ncbi:unnamed protein product, partial [Arabidopsis halleri]